MRNMASKCKLKYFEMHFIANTTFDRVKAFSFLPSTITGVWSKKKTMNSFSGFVIYINSKYIDNEIHKLRTECIDDNFWISIQETEATQQVWYEHRACLLLLGFMQSSRKDEPLYHRDGASSTNSQMET